MKYKSKFLTFILSWLPGLGHLYLGLNKRGLQFMAAFFACIVFNRLLPIVFPLFPFVLAILWFYALFDALQRATVLNAYISEGKLSGAVSSDSPAEQILSDLDQTVVSMEILHGKASFSPVWVGGISILIGILMLIRNVFPDVWAFLFRIHVDTILLAAALIWFGVWLIRTQVRKGE